MLKTNYVTGYVVVASFLTEDEAELSLVEALTIIKSWNSNWQPAHFICDYANNEINALETVFPGNTK